jgi:hypothetical protein
MSPAHSSPPPRSPALPAFLGGGRPPRHTLVCITSLRDLRRLVLLSLLGQLLTIALLIGHFLPPSPLTEPGRVQPGAHGVSQAIGTLALNPAASTTAAGAAAATAATTTTMAAATPALASVSTLSAAAPASLEASAPMPHGVTAPMPRVVVAP